MRRAIHSVSALVFIAIRLLPGETAQATIISGSLTGGSALGAGGVFEKLTPPLNNPFGPPNSVGNDSFQSFDLFGFDEEQNIVLTSPLQANIIVGGMMGTLPAGTTAASHYIFFDPTFATVTGTVEFDSDVLAIITSTTNLSNSDFLANTGVNYLNPGLRGLEFDDFVSITGPRQISVSFNTSSPGDYIRVLTAFSPGAVIPEPHSVVLMGLGICAVGGVALRRRMAGCRAKSSRPVPFRSGHTA